MAKLAVLLALAGAASAQNVPVDWRAALNRVSADSLRGHVSFLASDILEGRDTPSRGLDVAAEYIVSQYRRAGLEPGGGKGGFFHESAWKVHRPVFAGFAMSLEMDGAKFDIPPADVTLTTHRAFDFAQESAVLDSAGANGKVAFAGRGGVGPRWSRSGASLVIGVDAGGGQAGIASGARPFRKTADASRAPLLLIHRSGLPANPKEVKLTLHAAAPREVPFSMRNVAGILRGSDPVLSESYIVVTAHYDHVGRMRPGPGDRVFNGANDDASGTAAIVEIADALSRLPARPRRSVLFLALSGEEKGLLGTQAFVDEPSVPRASIVANVNVEVLGRSDLVDGPHLGKLTVTGIDFSSMGQTFLDAGKDTGVEVYKHKDNEAFFARSDNLVFARKGIPAHTASNAFVYSGYHGLDDEWQRLDYDNMARLTRTIALAILRLADSEDAPRWSDAPAARSYRDAAR